MLKSILRGATGSFSRTIGRILAYIAIGLILLILGQFISIADVHALVSIDLPTTQFNQAFDAKFYNCKTNDNCGEQLGSNQVELINWRYWMSYDTVQTVTQSSGMAISFPIDGSFIKGNYYTVSVLVAAKAIPTTVTTNNLKVGTGISPMFARDNIGKVTALNTTPLSIYYLDPDKNPTLWADNSAILSYTFQATGDGNYVFLTMTTQSTVTGKWELYGYNVTSQGSSAPSTEDISNALQSQFTNVLNDISQYNMNVVNKFNEVSQNVTSIGQASLNAISNLQQETFTKFDYLDETLASGFNQLNATINSATNKVTNKLDNLNSTQQETNNKLDNVNNTQQETNNKLDNLNNSLNDSSVNNSTGHGFFDEYTGGEDYNIGDIVTMPIDFLRKLLHVGNASEIKSPCFDIPFVETRMCLPQMWHTFGRFNSKYYPVWTLYTTIVNGMIAYHVAMATVELVKKLKDPENDEIEVMDL